MDAIRTTGAHGEPRTFEVALPAQLSSSARARRIVAEWCGDIDADTLADITLIASELMTNAIRHGQPEIMFRLRRTSAVLEVAVLDHGADAPKMQSVATDATSGRGLAIVDRLAMRWGCEALDDSSAKIVWATVSLV